MDTREEFGEDEDTVVRQPGDGVPFFRPEETTRAVAEEFFHRTYEKFGEWPEPEVVSPESVSMEEVVEEDDDSVSISLEIDVDLSQLENPPRARGPEWLLDPRASVAIAYAANLRPGRVLSDGGTEEARIAEFRHLLPAALAQRGLTLERVFGGWQVRGTL